MPATRAEATLAFGPFQADPLRRRLLEGERLIVLGTRAFDILMVLLEAPGELVSKHELLKRVWPTTVVNEHNIQVQVSALRKALADHRDMILTEVGRGYRLAAAVAPVPLEPDLAGLDDSALFAPQSAWPTANLHMLPPYERQPKLADLSNGPAARRPLAPAIDDPKSPVTFGRFCVIPGLRALLSDGRRVHLGARAFDVLIALIEARGELVTKGELLSRAWPGTAVKENSLQVQISTLRRILGEDRHVIVTQSGRGYRFTAKIRTIEGDTTALRMPELAAAAVIKGRDRETNLSAQISTLVSHEMHLTKLKNTDKATRRRRIQLLTWE